MSSRQNREIVVPNFAGGQCSSKAMGTLAANEMGLMQNVYLMSAGGGFKSREGNTVLNSTAIDSGAAVTGLGYLKTLAANEYLVAVAGTKVVSDTNFSGSFTDRTGSLTITSGQNNLWTFLNSGGNIIGVGGAPDAPFKYTGTGDAALLGGSPPSGRYGFQYGNRTFIMSTTTDPSTIYWTSLLDPEDWSGTGSGNADVEPQDGDYLVTAAPINLNTVILFKKNSVFLMTGRESPFPIFPLFQNTGCVGVHAAVVYDGKAYFITPDAKMQITDGNAILRSTHLPDIDDVWKSFRSFRLPQIQGTVVKGPDFDWIVWSCTKDAASTNDYAAVWDLRQECWLTCPTGFEANAYVTTLDNTTYMGGYDGKVYKIFAPTTYADASNGGAAVSWAVESDWITLSQLLSVKQVQRMNILHQTRATGTMTLSYGYDGHWDFTSEAFSIADSDGAVWDTALWDTATWDGYHGHIQNISLLGRGNYFKWRLTGSSQVSYEVAGVSMFGKNKSERNYGVA